MTMTISQFLGEDHIHCDELFAAAEAAATRADWPLVAAAFAHFRTALLHHLTIEEEIVFPAFERKTGNTHGPTSIMRQEHRQMRQLLDQLARAVTDHSAGDYGALAETLLMLIQQHNVKEEQVLYPLCDQVLGNETAVLLHASRAASG